MTDWYLIRATGLVSLVLFTVVTVLGIATARRWRPRRAPSFVTLGLHRSLSLLAVVFIAIHVVTAVLDPYAGVTVLSVLVPFAAHWRPLFVGLGTVSLDLVAALIVTSLVRRHLSRHVWRAVHLLAYVSWPAAIAHSLGTGTDASSPWSQAATLVCIAAVGTTLTARLLRRDGLPKHLAPQGAS